VHTDQFDDLIAGHPGLHALVRALTSAGTPRELAGERAALAMFRQVMAARATPSGPRHRSERAGLLAPIRRLALLGSAGVLALCASFAAAGYAAALPVPVQQVAHQLLGFAGVPSSRSPGHSPAHGTVPPAASGNPAPPGGRGGTAPGSQSGPPGPSGASSRMRLMISITRPRLDAGSPAALIALLTRDGAAVSGAKLSLLELSSGGQGWQRAASAITDPAGRATLTVPRLTANAVFRVSGPDGVMSGRLEVTVVPAITVSVTTGHGAAVTAAVTCPFCAAGDVVQLQVLSAGQWQLAHAKRLGRSGGAVFVLPSSKASASYRIMLLGTMAHDPAVSHVITVPPHGGKTGGGQGSGGHGER
jgi:hypothetical protein